jgi:hypothetical protein
VSRARGRRPRLAHRPGRAFHACDAGSIPITRFTIPSGRVRLERAHPDLGGPLDHLDRAPSRSTCRRRSPTHGIRTMPPPPPACEGSWGQWNQPASRTSNPMAVDDPSPTGTFAVDSWRQSRPGRRGATATSQLDPGDLLVARPTQSHPQWVIRGRRAWWPSCMTMRPAARRGRWVAEHAEKRAAR